MPRHPRHLTRTGIAVLTDGRPTLIRSIGHGGRNGDNYDQRSRRITSQCRAILDIIAPHTPHLALIEDQLYHGPMLPSALDRAALWWGVYSALRRRMPIAVINPATLKVWTTGKGNAEKLDMLNTTRLWYREAISNHDEADSIALATIGAYHCGDPLPFEPKARHATALEKVQWPEVARA